MDAVLVAEGAATLLAAAPLVMRVKREYEEDGVLSEFTVAAASGSS